MNPTLDYFAETERLIDDGKTRCHTTDEESGGGGINVARNLHRFGDEVLGILPTGGRNGKRLSALLETEGFPFQCIDIEQEPRQSLALTEKETDKLIHLVFDGPRLQEEEWRRCLETVKNLDPAPDYLVLSGSLPDGVPSDFYGIIAGAAGKAGIKVVLDTTGEALGFAGNKNVYLAKMNYREFVSLGYSGERESQAILSAMGEMLEDDFAENLIVTLGEDGAVLARQAGDRLHLRPPRVEVISYVGAGDSFVSVMVHQLARERSVAEAFRYGVAAAAAKISMPGNQLKNLDKVDEFYDRVTVELSQKCDR